MRAKIISLILCISIAISPSVAISYQTNNPDPEFLGNFMVYNFLTSQFNLKESQKYQEALSDIPEDLRGLTKVWTLVYLSWVFKHLVNEKYGKQFADKMLDTANKKWVKAGEFSGEYMEVYNYWFPKLDNMVKKSIGKTIKGKEIPIEVFITWSFLSDDPSSPFYQQINPDIKNLLDFLIAIALAEAKEAAMMFMANVVEIGGPIDSDVGSGGEIPKQSNPPQASKKAPAVTMDDISQYKNYYDLVVSIYEDYMQIHVLGVQIEDLAKSYLNEKITLEYAEEKKRLILAEIKLSMHSANNKNEELPPPRMNQGRLQTLAQSFYSYVKGLPQSIEKGSEISVKLFNACILGSHALIEKYDLLTRENLITMLEGENIIAKSTVAQSDENAPTAWLYETFVRSNEGMIALIKARIAEISGSTDDIIVEAQNKESRTYIELAEISLADARKNISTGRAKIEVYRDNFKNTISNKELDKYGPLFDRILDSFYESFDVESDIIQTIKTMIDRFPSEEGIDEVSVVIDSLIKKRANLERKRMQLASSVK